MILWTRSRGIFLVPIDQTVQMQGKVFGRLTVVGRGGVNGKGQRQWVCHCVCGEVTVKDGCDLRAGKIKSCGCLSRDIMRQRRETKREAARNQ